MNFWDYHGILFLIGLWLFPRLTMLFFTTYGGGLLYWLGWFFVPRITAAVIGTILYSDNTLLLIFAWIIALCSDTAEKSVIVKPKGSKHDMHSIWYNVFS